MPGLMQRFILTFLLLSAAAKTPQSLLGQTAGFLDDADFNLLIQTNAQYGEEGNGPLGKNGFRVRRVRPRLAGNVNEQLRFAVQADLVRDFPVLDARFTWDIAQGWEIRGGLYKSPFSMEYLENVGRLDFVMRSRVVRSLAPQRNVGLAVRKAVTPMFRLQLSAFNGNGGSTFANDNASLMYVGRITFDSGQEDDDLRLRMGLNAAYSEDENVRIRNVDPAFSGKRALAGGDVWLDAYSWTVKGESIYMDTNRASLGSSGAFWGAYLTVVRHLPADWNVAIRWDRWHDGETSDDLVLGITRGVRGAVKLQMNAQIPVTDHESRPYAALGMVQIAL